MIAHTAGLKSALYLKPKSRDSISHNAGSSLSRWTVKNHFASRSPKTKNRKTFCPQKAKKIILSETWNARKSRLLRVFCLNIGPMPLGLMLLLFLAKRGTCLNRPVKLLFGPGGREIVVSGSNPEGDSIEQCCSGINPPEASENIKLLRLERSGFTPQCRIWRWWLAAQSMTAGAKKVNRVKALLLLSCFLLGCADFVTTNVILDLGMGELNPFMKLAQSWFGMWWLLPKLGLTLVVTWLLWRSKNVYNIALVVAFCSTPVLNNLLLIIAGTN